MARVAGGGGGGRGSRWVSGRLCASLRSDPLSRQPREAALHLANSVSRQSRPVSLDSVNSAHRKQTRSGENEQTCTRTADTLLSQLSTPLGAVAATLCYTNSNLCNSLIKPLQRPTMHCNVAWFKMLGVSVRPIIHDSCVVIERCLVAKDPLEQVPMFVNDSD